MQWPLQIDLKFCLINAENLFLLFDPGAQPDPKSLNESQWQKLSTSVYENKPLRKAHALAQSLLEINADIIMLCEVGGLESLKNFNELFLGNQYAPCLMEGNSNRNIDVGFLVRRGLGFYYDLYSNKNRSINFLYPHEKDSLANGYPLKGGKVYQSHKFSRDVLEMRLFTQDPEKPFLLILLTHLKSRLDPERIDPNGFERRQAELKTLLEIYGELIQKYPGVPVMVAGDFNGNASAHGTDEEFRPLYATTDLQDVLEIATLTPEQRATYYQIRNAGRVEGRQIDFVFFSQLLRPHLKDRSASVYRYRDDRGLPQDPPTHLEAKLLLPSDHYPVVFEIHGLPLEASKAGKES